MDDLPLHLLSEEDDEETEKDTIRSPGSDTLYDRTYPTWMLYLQHFCTCDCFLRTDSCPSCISPTEDELASIMDDDVDLLCYENDSFLYNKLDVGSLVANDLTQPMSTAGSVGQMLDKGFPDEESQIDLLCDPYIGGNATSPGSDSPGYSSSPQIIVSVPLPDNTDMFQISPNPSERISRQKRKRSDDSSHRETIKGCCNTDDLFSTLNKITSQPQESDENELRYGFYIKCEDG
ncbi:uncharacterized protein LOC117322218 [Pecten maximus]|uniref:uncharacterized protein LOC117322218 n=1 Tax=Pecten maximus TaxID=6579 RepID=UPI0014580FC4|nr:uncharacterized protein LOC117322218 [Pecten maximus]